LQRNKRGFRKHYAKSFIYNEKVAISQFFLNNRNFSIEEELPSDTTQLLRDFKRWLFTLIPAGKRIILLIDVVIFPRIFLPPKALNQLNPDGELLGWLPELFSTVQIKVIVTTTSHYTSSGRRLVCRR
jgi:hypothetical protein